MFSFSCLIQTSISICKQSRALLVIALCRENKPEKKHTHIYIYNYIIYIYYIIYEGLSICTVLASLFPFSIYGGRKHPSRKRTCENECPARRTLCTFSSKKERHHTTTFPTDHSNTTQRRANDRCLVPNDRPVELVKGGALAAATHSGR